MSVRLAHLEAPGGVPPGMPSPRDVADLWLLHSFACLLDACGLSAAERARLFDSGVDVFLPEPHPHESESLLVGRLDSCRLALVFAPLAVEARLNRVLRRCDAAEWRAVAHLAPAERFRLAPRLLDELEWSAEDAQLAASVADVFAVRDELVDADGWSGAAPPETPLRFTAARAREIVEASARVCHFLATLTDDEESGVARIVEDAAAALERRAEARSGIARGAQAEWSREVEFPPDVLGD